MRVAILGTDTVGKPVNEELPKAVPQSPASSVANAAACYESCRGFSA
jgi:hypothetical protein